jgi:hypothetical protein
VLGASLALAAALLLSACSKGSDGSTTKSQQVRSGLANLSSYKCSMKISGDGGPLSDLDSLFAPPNASGTPVATRTQENIGFDATVVYVKPDKSVVSVQLGNDIFSQTTIGRQQWVTLGGLSTGPNTVSQQSPSDLSLCSAFWDDGFAGAASSFTCTGRPEKVNGISTLKCSITKESFEQMRQALGGVLSASESGIKDLSRFTMDIWVADGSGKVPGGLPVRFQADMAGTDDSNKSFSLKISMDVSNINDSKLTVAAPKQ